VLQVVDARWREHLDSMEYLRDGIHLRAMAQKDPLVEYRNEGSAMFDELNAFIREEVARYLFHVEVEQPEGQTESDEPRYDTSDQDAGDGNLVYEHESVAGADAIAAATGGAAAAPAAAGVATAAAPSRPAPAQAQAAPDPFAGTGRNQLCPCGSGKKYKKCHGA
jgi:preprotein translocase subunit SecA